VRNSYTQQNSEKHFKSQGAVQTQVQLEFRSLASLASIAVWLDQEEESVQLVQSVDLVQLAPEDASADCQR
jgi:hypothetical protein